MLTRKRFPTPTTRMHGFYSSHKASIRSIRAVLITNRRFDVNGGEMHTLGTLDLKR